MCINVGKLKKGYMGYQKGASIIFLIDVNVTISILNDVGDKFHGYAISKDIPELEEDYKCIDANDSNVSSLYTLHKLLVKGVQLPTSIPII